MKFLTFVVMCGLLGLTMAHSYKSGECPPLEPMQGFDMRKVSNSIKSDGVQCENVRENF